MAWRQLARDIPLYYVAVSHRAVYVTLKRDLRLDVQAAVAQDLYNVGLFSL